MLHKLGYDYICERCGKPASDDDSSACDYENNLCTDCVDADMAEAYAYWRPLYDGEKQAGLLPEKD